MQIHLSKNGAQAGPFTEAQAREMIASGQYAATDLGWHPGLSDWQPLGTLLSSTSVPPPLSASSLFTSPPPQAASAAAPAASQTSGTAIGSLVCGILGLVTIIPSLAAVILGHISLTSIKKSGGALRGRGMAVAGLVMGYLILAVFPFLLLISLAVPTFNAVQEQANLAKTAANARQIVLAAKTYATEHDGQFPSDLEVLFHEQLLTDRRVLDTSLTLPRKVSGWDYRGTGRRDDGASRLLLLVSQQAGRRGQRVVAFSDGSVEILPQTAFQRLEAASPPP